MIESITSPYTLAEQPTSVGRVLLARAFSHWCVLHHGLDVQEVAAALDPDGQIDACTRQEVHFAARLLGELFASGEMKTWVRPFGGGSPVPLQPGEWEIDDFRERVARSAIDPARPFDPSAEPTHWIFIDLEDFNRVVSQSCGEATDETRSVRHADTREANQAQPQSAAADLRSSDRLLRMPEVKRRTGMSASTIYRRIEEKRFPKQIPIERGNIAAWLESEVAEWIANPR